MRNNSIPSWVQWLVENPMKSIATVFLSLTLLVAFFGSFEVVNPGERGVYVLLGKASDTVLTEGLHFKVPFVSEIRKISVRIQKSEAGSEAASKDMQRVVATLALNWHIDPATVNTMFKTIGTESEIAERIIKPAVSEVLKASTAKMTAEEILTKRLELKSNIDHLLTTRLKAYNVLVDDISLTDLDFTKEFNHAVEAKQVSEQQAKQAEYVALKATQDAKAAVNTAKGEAESNLARARAQAEANLTLAKSQAEAQRLLKANLTQEVLALEWLKRWNGDLPQVMTGNGNSPAMMFNVNTLNRSQAVQSSSTTEEVEP